MSKREELSAKEAEKLYSKTLHICMERYQLEVGSTEETMWMNIKAHKNTARIDMRIDSESLGEMEEINDTIKV